MVHILFFKIVIIVVSLGAYSGAGVEQSFPLTDLKQFSVNPNKFCPTSSNHKTGGDICQVWQKLYQLDPFVQEQWRSLMSKSKNIDEDVKGKSPFFSFYLAMRICLDDKPPQGCENLIESNGFETKTFEELLGVLAKWWNESVELRVKTNQILDTQSLKLYKFVQRTNVHMKDREALVIDTAFSTDCAKFMNKIFQGYGKLTSEPECKAEKWEVLQAAALKLDWSSKRDQADPEELCSPEMKAALEYEVKRMGDCSWSLKNIKNVVRGETPCFTPPGTVDQSNIIIRYNACVAELWRGRKYGENWSMIIRAHPACMSETECSDTVVDQFETALFVARVWRKYCFPFLFFRVFNIRSLVPFIEFTKYSTRFRSCSERLFPDLAGQLSIMPRLAAESVLKRFIPAYVAAVLIIC